MCGIGMQASAMCTNKSGGKKNSLASCPSLERPLRPGRLALPRPSLALPSLIRHCNAPKLFECEINVCNKFRCNLLAFASNAHRPEHANLTSIETNCTKANRSRFCRSDRCICDGCHIRGKNWMHMPLVRSTVNRCQNAILPMNEIDAIQRKRTRFAQILNDSFCHDQDFYAFYGLRASRTFRASDWLVHNGQSTWPRQLTSVIMQDFPDHFNLFEANDLFDRKRHTHTVSVQANNASYKHRK